MKAHSYEPTKRAATPMSHQPSARYFYSDYDDVGRYYDYLRYGFSVRCLKPPQSDTNAPM